MKNGFTMPKAGNFHCHLREGAVLDAVIDATADYFCTVVDMPNKKKPIASAAQVIEHAAIVKTRRPDLRLISTIYFTADLTVEEILAANDAGASVIKFMPVSSKGQAGTTNAHFGMHPRDLLKRKDHLAAICERKMKLASHCEDPDVDDWLEREKAFFPYLLEILRMFPDIEIIFEHITSRAALSFVHDYPNVSATITPHHLVLTKSDWYGNHDCLCMPVAKSEDDRVALNEAVMSGHPRIIPGTDSAPHPRSTKDKAKGSFGLWVDLTAIPIYAQQFEKYGKLSLLQPFLCKTGFDVYGIDGPTGELELVREEWTVPDAAAVPHDPTMTFRHFKAGETLPWKVRIR